MSELLFKAVMQFIQLMYFTKSTQVRLLTSAYSVYRTFLNGFTKCSKHTIAIYQRTKRKTVCTL